MKITDIRIKRKDSVGKMKAVVSVTFDDMFVVHDMKIIEGQDGCFVAMPSRKTATGEYRDVAHPINMEMREKLHKEILKAYAEMPEK